MKIINLSIFLFLSTFVFGQSIPVSKVLVYSVHDKPDNFVVVGLLNASSDASFSAKKATDKNISKLRKKAAKMGANGIIIDHTSSTDEAMLVNGTLISGTTQNMSATAIKVQDGEMLVAQPKATQNGYKFYYPIPSHEPETVKEELSRLNLADAYYEYNVNKNLKSTKFYLVKSERDGFRSKSFYYLFGRMEYDHGNKSAAKRYWKRGYDKYGCEECKDLFVAVKFGESIIPVVKAHNKKRESDKKQ